MNIDLEIYLASLYIGPWFGLKDPAKGHVYENIIVHDNTKKLPSKSECEAGIIDLQAEWDAKESDQLKQNAFQAEADPLFFKWQAGEIPEQEWKDKRAEIKARFAE